MFDMYVLKYMDHSCLNTNTDLLSHAPLSLYIYIFLWQTTPPPVQHISLAWRQRKGRPLIIITIMMLLFSPRGAPLDVYNM